MTHKADADWLNSWFDLDRYPETELKSYGADRWGQQFEIRRRLLHRLEFPRLFENAPCTREWCLQRLRDAPLSIGGVMPRIIDRMPVMDMGHEEVRGQQWLYEQPGMKNMVDAWDAQNAHLDHASRMLNTVFRHGVRLGGMHGLSAHCQLLETLSARELTPEGLTIDNASFSSVLQVGYAGIDFRFSDATIKEHFDSWLKQKRIAFEAAGLEELTKHHAQPKKAPIVPSKASMQRWAAKKVLPFLDIRIMADVEGLEAPTAEVLAEALFPRAVTRHGEYIVPKVRIDQELKPLAERLLDQGAIERLILDGQGGAEGR